MTDAPLLALPDELLLRILWSPERALSREEEELSMIGYDETYAEWTRARLVCRRFHALLPVLGLMRRRLEDDRYHASLYEPRVLCDYGTDVARHYEEGRVRLFDDIERHGLAGIARDLNHIIAGGFVLYHMIDGTSAEDAWSGGDIDVFAAADSYGIADAFLQSMPDFEKHRPTRGDRFMYLRHDAGRARRLRPIQIIPMREQCDCYVSRPQGDAIENVLGRFDLNVCQFGVHGGELLATPLALLGVEMRSFWMTQEDVGLSRADRLRDRKRKYSDRGFAEKSCYGHKRWFRTGPFDRECGWLGGTVARERRIRRECVVHKWPSALAEYFSAMRSDVIDQKNRIREEPMVYNTGRNRIRRDGSPLKKKRRAADEERTHL